MNLKIVNTHVVTMQLPEGTTAGIHIIYQPLPSWDPTLDLPGKW